MNFRKSIGSAAVAFALLLSSCSSSSEEALTDTGIQARLVAATGISWSVDFSDDRKKVDTVYGANGYIQQIYTSPSECYVDIFVFQSDELAKDAMSKKLLWEDVFPGLWQFDDPITNYGIILGERFDDEPCTVDAASAFDFVIPRKN